MAFTYEQHKEMVKTEYLKLCSACEKAAWDFTNPDFIQAIEEYRERVYHFVEEFEDAKCVDADPVLLESYAEIYKVTHHRTPTRGYLDVVLYSQVDKIMSEFKVAEGF